MSDAVSHKIVPLFNVEAIAGRVEGLALELVPFLPPDVTVVALLKGAFVFAADLVRALDRHGIHPKVEFLQVGSYGLGTQSTGRVKVIGAMPESVAGCDVLLVDDIQDTARTLAWTRDLLLGKGARSVRSCALLDKPSRRQVPFEADHIGFSIEDWFVVGYGIDWAERYRHLPWIGRVDFEQE